MFFHYIAESEAVHFFLQVKQHELKDETQQRGEGMPVGVHFVVEGSEGSGCSHHHTSQHGRYTLPTMHLMVSLRRTDRFGFGSWLVSLRSAVTRCGKAPLSRARRVPQRDASPTTMTLGAPVSLLVSVTSSPSSCARISCSALESAGRPAGEADDDGRWNSDSRATERSKDRMEIFMLQAVSIRDLLELSFGLHRSVV